MKIQKIFVGGWFQRTTLHLSEFYDFIKDEESPLDLKPERLDLLKKDLGVKSASLKASDLDFVDIKNEDGIDFKFFEDGLMILNKDHQGDVKKDIKDLTDYYEKKISPAISYIYSLGAPIPKELANIKNIYPYFLVLENATKEDVQKLLENFGQDKYLEIKEHSFEIYRGDKLYIINNISEKMENLEKFICEQIFFREFKGQLHRYLNLHRIIWEKIADVKERGKIRGNKVGEFSSKIESYSKTINLIEARINQMGIYASTREAIVKSNPDMQKFVEVLQFKYDSLNNTLSYVKDIWQMTKNYVNSASNLFSSIQASSTESSVENLTVVTSMGVGATLIGLFAQERPEFTLFGISYFFILAAIGFLANKVMRQIGKRRMYAIEDVEINKNIK